MASGGRHCSGHMHSHGRPQGHLRRAFFGRQRSGLSLVGGAEQEQWQVITTGLLPRIHR